MPASHSGHPTVSAEEKKMMTPKDETLADTYNAKWQHSSSSSYYPYAPPPENPTNYELPNATFSIAPPSDSSSPELSLR